LTIVEEIFYQISLSEASSKLTTFNTPLGRYCFSKLPIGLNAPAIFYKHFSPLIEGLEKVQVYMNDIIILIFGKNEEEHKPRLMNVNEWKKNNG